MCNKSVANRAACAAEAARPLITPQWAEENPEEWDRHWRMPEVCPVCHEKPVDKGDLWDGPMNSDIPTRCTHFLCVQCWTNVAARDDVVRCPVCRDDVTEFAARFRE